MAKPHGAGHNGGPPLDDAHEPEWGRGGGAGRYFAWKRAHEAVWRKVSWDKMLRRQRRAERIGLTYEEYTLEILERGRHLQPEDRDRIEAIKRARPALTLARGGGTVPPVRAGSDVASARGGDEVRRAARGRRR